MGRQGFQWHTMGSTDARRKTSVGSGKRKVARLWLVKAMVAMIIRLLRMKAMTKWMLKSCVGLAISVLDFGTETGANQHLANVKHVQRTVKDVVMVVAAQSSSAK